MAKEKIQPSGALVVPEAFQIGEVEVNKEVMLAKRTEDVKLIINGIDDKEGYKKAHTLRASYRTVRTTLEKVRKDMSAPHQAYVKQLKETTDELGKIAQVAEDYFDTIMTEIDDEKARIAKEKELAEQKRIAGRINELVALGATFDGENYTFPYNETLIVSAEDVKELGIQAFSDTICDIEVEYEKEQQRIQDELLKQQEAEEARLAEIEAQRIIAQTNALEATKLLNKRTALRVKELKLMGFVESNGIYSHSKCDTILPGAINNQSDEEWEQLIATVEEDINRLPIPVENDIPVAPADNWFEGIGDNSDLNEPINEVASGNPVSEPEQSYVANDVQKVEYIETHKHVGLEFTAHTPYTDSDVTPKTFLRVFPEQFELEAINDCIVMAKGTVQALGWAIIKRD